MMRNSFFQRYKRIFALMILAACGIVFWFVSCHRQPLPKRSVVWQEKNNGKKEGKRCVFEGNGLKGSVVFGARGHIPMEKTSPVVLKLFSEEEDFRGFMQIILPGEDGKSIVYQKKILSPADVEKEFRMNVPQLGTASCFSFQILDSYQVEKVSKVIVPEWVSGENAERILYLGVLSDRFDRLNYLDGIVIGGEDYLCEVRTIRYKAEDFPENADDLAPLSGVIVDGIDTGNLSGKQIDCLKEYVASSGGCLVIGTGSSGKEVLSGIRKFIGVSDGEKVEQLVEFSGKVSSAARVNLTIDEVRFHKNTLWEPDGLTSTDDSYTCPCGTGKLILTRYSFSEKEFSSWHNARNAATGLLKSALEPEEILREDDRSLARSWYLESALYSYMSSLSPDTFYYGSFFLIYIIALAVFSYYLLRAIRKRELIWLVVPVLSVSFTIYLSLHSVGLAEPNDSSFSVFHISDSGREKDECYMLYQNGDREDMNMKLRKEVSHVEPQDYKYFVELQESLNPAFNKPDYTVDHTESGIEIAFSEVVPGTSRVLRLDVDREKKDPCFEADLVLEPTWFQGRIRNISRKNFEKVVMIRGCQYVVLDGIAAGEVKTIGKNAAACLNAYEESSHFADEMDESTALGNALFYIENTYLEDSRNLNETLIIGVSEEDEFSLFANGDELSNQIGLSIDRVEDKEKDPSLRQITNINRFCLRSDEDGSLLYDTLDGMRTKATYQFDPGEHVRSLNRNRDSFSGVIYAYNFQKETEDPILRNWDDSISGEDLKPYLSDRNVLILTYQIEEETENVAAPILSAVTAGSPDGE